MSWGLIALIAICVVISPFEALYLYNKAEEMKHKRREKRENGEKDGQP